MTESPRADLNKDPKEIASMFDSLASRYDVMDALMTGGLDRVWMTARFLPGGVCARSV